MALAPFSQIEVYNGLLDQLTTSGNLLHDGTKTKVASLFPSVVIDPAVGGKNRAIQFPATSTGAESKLHYPLRYLHSNAGASDPVNEFDDIYQQAEVYIDVDSKATGKMSFLSIEDSASTVIARAIISISGGVGVFKVSADNATGAPNSSSATGLITNQAWNGVITMHYTRDINGDGTGSITLYQDGTQIATVAHDDTSKASIITYGAVNNSLGSNASIGIHMRKLACARQEDLDLWPDIDITNIYEPDQGMGMTMDTDQTTAKVHCGWNPGNYDASWENNPNLRIEVRLFNGKNALTTGTPDQTVVITPAAVGQNAQFALGVATISGLSPASWYTYKVRAYLSGAPGTFYENANTSIFRTLSNVAEKFSVGEMFCMKFEDYSPINHARWLADREPLMVMVNSDWYYNDKAGALLQPMATTPAATYTEFITNYWDTMHNRFFGYLGRRTSLRFNIGDHDAAWNNYAHSGVGNEDLVGASQRLGYAEATYNPAGGSGSDRASTNFDGDAKLQASGFNHGQVVDAGKQALYDFWGKGFLGNLRTESSWADSEVFRKMETADTLILIADSRTFQDPTTLGNEPTSNGGPTVFGPYQMDKLLGEINSTTKSNVLFVVETVMNDIYDTGDNLNKLPGGPGERDQIEAAIEANANIKRGAYMVADRHASEVNHRFQVGDAGRTVAAPKMLLEMLAGPFAGGLVPEALNPQPSDRVDFLSTLGTTTGGSPTRGYGVMEIDEIGGTFTVNVYHGDTNSRLFNGRFPNVSANGFRSRPTIGTRREAYLGGRP